jgi:hypothetical protein
MMRENPREYEIIGNFLVERLVPLKEQYSRAERFRRIMKNEHLTTIIFWGCPADKYKKCKHSEIVSIWHPLDPKVKCDLRDEFAQSGRLQKMIQQEITSIGTSRNVWRHWLAVKPGRRPKSSIMKLKKPMTIACTVGDNGELPEGYDAKFFDLLQAAGAEAKKEGYIIEDVSNEFEGMIDEFVEGAREDIGELEKELAIAKSELGKAKKKLDTAKTAPEKHSAEKAVKFWEDSVADIKKQMQTKKVTLDRQEVRPRLERELSLAITRVLKANKDVLGTLKSIKVIPMLPDPKYLFNWRAVEHKKFILVLSGLLPIREKETWKLAPFKVAIEGGQTAAKFVANLHNALLRLKHKIGDKKVYSYLNTIQNESEIVTLSRQHYLRDVEGSPGKFSGLLVNLIWKNLPTGIDPDTEKKVFAGAKEFELENLLVKDSPEYKAKIEETKESLLDKRHIQQWLKDDIGYVDEVQWTKGTTGEDI